VPDNFSSHISFKALPSAMKILGGFQQQLVAAQSSDDLYAAGHFVFQILRLYCFFRFIAFQDKPPFHNHIGGGCHTASFGTSAMDWHIPAKRKILWMETFEKEPIHGLE